MLKAFSTIGNVAYKTASKSGIAAGTEQPPYPCASPLRSLDNTTDVESIEAILDAVYASVRDMLGDMSILNASLEHKCMQKSWKLLDFDDPNGDFSLYTRPHVGPYNFAKAFMTMERVTPTTVLQSMHAQNLEVRKAFSCHLRHYEAFGHNPRLPEDMRKNDDAQLREMAQMGLRDWYFEYSQMSAPPPVAARDLMFLIEKRYVAAEGAYYIYGCSVDYTPYSKMDSRCIRAIAMWGWKLIELRGNTVATYTSCMNPNGWAPTFLLDWMKSAIAKELTNARQLIYKARDCADASRSGNDVTHLDTVTHPGPSKDHGDSDVASADAADERGDEDAGEHQAGGGKTLLYDEQQHEHQESLTVASSETSVTVHSMDISDSSEKKTISSDMDVESREAEWINSISRYSDRMCAEDERVLALEEELTLL